MTVVGANKGVDNTHNHNSILEASKKRLSEEVAKQIDGLFEVDCRTSPGSNDEIVKKRALVVV